MKYDNVIYDFIDRTRANLRLIEEHAAKAPQSDGKGLIEGNDREAKAFEVTQLVNSLLGLVVFPQQHYREQIPKEPLSKLEAMGWPKPLVKGEFPDDLNNLADLMRYVRNSIAHFNIEFTSSNNQTIDGIRVWNNRKENGKNGKEVENWSVFLQIEELKILVNKFVDLSLSLNKADQKREVL